MGNFIRMRVKYTAKWGSQIAEMIFQTRSRGRQRGQDNFKLAANFGYNSRGSADPRESLRKRRILKLALSAHKVFAAPGVLTTCWILAGTGKRNWKF